MTQPTSVIGNRLAACSTYLEQAVSIAPLVVFRMIFGLLMLGSTARFWYLGWIDDHYLQAKMSFKYYGFEWVDMLSPTGMYALHVVMILASLGILLGFYYKIATIFFFLSFTYVELIDLTYYLNHYYFVNVVSFLLILVPANRHFSLDVLLNPSLDTTTTPRWTILIFQLQLAIVYVFAGLAKLNYDWLINALPLKIWLPANDYFPLIGWIFTLKITPYVFSWFGMIYDTTIVFWLINTKTRLFAYVSVVVFHVLTGLLFQIGVFPVVMMGATWIFFSDNFHEKTIQFLNKGLNRLLKTDKEKNSNEQTIDNQVFTNSTISVSVILALAFLRRRSCQILVILKSLITFLCGVTAKQAGLRLHRIENRVHRLGITEIWQLRRREKARWIFPFLILFFMFQILFPWRYLLYPNNHYWSEEGYRFGWRVMLMEKAGTATFYVKDAKTGREGIVNNADFLCSHQEKQMSMQPDMILQFAHFLKKEYEKRGVIDPSVRAEVYVTLNGRPSQLLIDSTLDLTKIIDSWSPKTWILHYEK